VKSFFEHQSLARRNTRVMVVLFILAVIAIVAAVDAVIAVTWMWANELEAQPPAGVYALGAIATIALILSVSGVNVMRLSGGGPAVARMIGAREVPSGTTDPLERRLRNVVEEMAIASGVRVPGIYVMDGERGINAFAAGWDVSRAVVAVTRGTLETLTRDELQGVVAHEFSHILNGDMRLNIRIIGVLAGIVFLGSVGEFVMRSARGSRKDAAPVLLAGLAVFVIGYMGLFFARLIKASIARQREFLADASSVQFTRNPEGIAGALDQIRSSGAGTLIASRYAEEMSHMFFGQSVKVRLAGLFATHPPLEERIRRVHPRFRPEDYRARRASTEALPKIPVEQKGRRSGDVAAAWGRSPVESAALVGTLDAGHVERAARLVDSLPAGLRDALREPEGAAAAMLALLLAGSEAAMQQQLSAVPAALAARAKGLAPAMRGLGAELHLPLIDLALPAAKAAPEGARRELLAALESAINADRRVSLHEFVVLALVRDQLMPPGRVAETRKIADLKDEAATVLALVAHAGTRVDATGRRGEALQAALSAGARMLGIAYAEPPLTLDSAHRALEALRALAPMQKGVLVKGLFAAVTHDGTIGVAEAELMRLVGAVLDCPLPPLLDPGLPQPL
jgi:Zn-dependent protease with chaperone function